MTETEKEKAIKNRHVLNAWFEGKVIQYASSAGNDWSDYPRDKFPGIWGLNEFRIKPESKLRPWNEHTFPINCVLMHRSAGAIYRPCSWESRGVLISICLIDYGIGKSESYMIKWDELTVLYKYSTDGLTWKECGITDNAQAA